MAGAGAAPAEEGAAKLGRTLFSRGALGTALGTAPELTDGAGGAGIARCEGIPGVGAT